MTESARPEIHPVDLDERRSDQGVWNGAMAEMNRTGVRLESTKPPVGAKPKKQIAEISGSEMTRRHDMEPLPEGARPASSLEIAALKALARAGQTRR